MPRPKKCRKVCNIPQNVRFGPLNTLYKEDKYLIMTVEEYEVIRLIDLENMTQEECACQMNVARTTIQAIYFEARKKLAKALVEQSELRVEGGDYRLCDGLTGACHSNVCLQKFQNDKISIGNCDA